MTSNFTSYLIRVLNFLIVTSLFTLGFYQNQWQVLPMEDVLLRRDISEIYIMGRLVKSHQDGVFSAGGLLGMGDVPKLTVEGYAIKNQYVKYDKERSFNSYVTYRSHPGFQGLFYSIFDAWTDFAPSTNLFVFRLSTSLALALVLSGICFWFLSELGWLAAISAVVCILISKWLALLGGNLFWSLWSFYLPLFVLSFLLRSVHDRSEYVSSLRFMAIVFFLSLIKVLFTGFEFITTGLLMITVPFIYYAVLDGWTWKEFIRGYINMGIGLAGSVVAGLLILSIQVRMDAGSFQAALDHIVFSWQNRTYGHDALTDGVSTSAAGAIQQTFEVVGWYLNGYAFALSNRYPVASAFVKDLLDGRYLYIIILFAIATVLLMTLYARSRMVSDRRTGFALIAATWYSILAPLSWLVIFRDHARGHTLLDFIVWQMPFVLYGFALIGFSLSSLVKLNDQTR